MSNLILKRYEDMPKSSLVKEQVRMCTNVPEEIRNHVEKFLVETDIPNVQGINGKVKEEFREYILQKTELSETQKNYYKNALEQIQLFHFSQDMSRSNLKEQIEEIKVCLAAKNKLFVFLSEKGVYDADEITYEIRAAYEEYLKQSISQTKVQEYVKVLDKVKLEALKKANINKPFRPKGLKYRSEKIFLLYHPNYDLAMSFYFVQDKSELVFDFSLEISDELKHQIFDMLNHVLEEVRNLHDRRERFILPLRRLYLYCVEKGITDVSNLELGDIQGFRESLEGNVGTKTNIYMQIIGNIRKYCYMRDSSLEKDVWYMEFLKLDRVRINPAREIKKISFTGIMNKENRDLFKCYMKYQVGVIPDVAMQTVRGQYYDIRTILKYCDKHNISILTFSEKELIDFLDEMEQKEIKPETYNRIIITLVRFLDYLTISKKIEKSTISPGYYYKKTYAKHNNRLVSEDILENILRVSGDFPEHIRLMFLNLYNIGLRVSEVCGLKGDAYSRDEKDAWIKVWQPKMKRWKSVPISQELYEKMRAYIMSNHIQKDEYIFKNRSGGAYNADTFCKQIKRHLVKAGISEEEYKFRAHDFRHTVATRLYRGGVSIEVIRDYLGHRDSDMTRQYLDYMQEAVNKSNEEFFSDENNRINWTWERGNNGKGKNIS